MFCTADPSEPGGRSAKKGVPLFWKKIDKVRPAVGCGGVGLRARGKHSLRVGWRKLVRVSLIFAIIVSFMLYTVFPLVYLLYFEEFLIQDSRGYMILKKI